MIIDNTPSVASWTRENILYCKRGLAMDYFMEGIYQYYETSQKVAEAIEAVMGIDVTIMNDSMERIAGTGRYKSQINEKIEKYSAFDYCLNTGKPQVIVDQGQDNPICKRCPRFMTCEEKAEVCVPIKQGEVTIGVIGVIAFNGEQKDRIIRDNTLFLNFLEKMSNLLEAKYSEYQISMEKKVLTDRLIGALNTISAGVVLYGGKGDVLYKNEALFRILDEIGIEHKDEFVRELWSNHSLQKMLAERKYPDSSEITVEHDGDKYTLLASITYLKKNSKADEIILTLENINRIKKQIIQSLEINQVKFQFVNILGISENFLEVKRLAEKAALTDSNVLICGESGTGKELFARAIHNHSRRKEYNFVPINCGAIPDELLESELFGYEKGAFTGAVANKIGKFEVADNGTIFLDEIGEMPLRLQVKLLRAIQEREICRIGSNRIQKVNVKFIAATNSDLLQRTRDGLFREDLYYRLNVIPIYIPPLRERREDIIYLANYFVRFYGNAFNKSIGEIPDKVLDIFFKYHWPGNVRELQSIIEHAVSFETGNTISLEFIEKRLKINNKTSFAACFNTKSLDTAIKSFEKDIIENSISKYRFLGNKEHIVNQVCNDLNISRATLYRKLKELQINLNNEKNLNNEM